MALQFISIDSFPTYIAVSTDIVDGKISGASMVGKTVLTTDDGEWYIIKKDLVLASYELPINFGGSITIGTVNQGTAGIDPWLITLASKYAELRLSQTEYAQVHADEFHFHVHNGTLWNATYIQTGLATNATVDICVTTTGKECHFAANHTASGEGRVDYYLSSAFTGGTPVLMLNHNYGLGGSPTTAIVSNATVTGVGTLKRSIYVPGGSGGNRSGGFSPFSREFIIPTNSTLRLRFTNLDGSNAIYNLVTDFYEE